MQIAFSRRGRLFIPHLTARWHICQHFPPQPGYKLPRSGYHWRFNRGFHWDEGWKLWELSSDVEIVWKWQQCPRLHADNSDSLKNQVRKEALSCEFLHFDNFPFPEFSPISGVAFDFSLNMNPLMCPHGAMAVVHVVHVGIGAVVHVCSHHLMASSPHHPTQTTTHIMQNASTPSHSLLAQSSCWIFSALIYMIMGLFVTLMMTI